MSIGGPRRCAIFSQRTGLFAAGLSLAIFLQLFTAQAAEQKSLDELERVFTREKNQRKRARLALDILDLRLTAIRAYVATGTMLEEKAPALSAYEEGVSRLDQAVHAAAHVGTSKRVEVGLRRQLKDLEQIRANVSALERPFIEALAARVVKLRETVLYSIMAPKK